MLELDRLPRGLLLLAFAVGTAGIVGAALLAGEEGFLGRLGARGSELVATLAFGFAGLSELALRLRKRIQRRRTQDLAVLTFERVESELSELAQHVFRILVQATPEAGSRMSPDIGPAFRVPIEKTQRAYWHDALDRAIAQRDAFEIAAKPLTDSLGELSKAQHDEQLRAAKEKTDQGSPKGKYERFATFETGNPDPVLDFACLVESADEQLPALREQWSALAEVSTQLASLLESDEAKPLLERNLELRACLSTYSAFREPTGLSEDPDQRELQLQLWRIDCANDAYSMVLSSLRSAWAMLEALDDVFRHRVGRCDGASRHHEAKRTFDAKAALERQERALEQQIEKLRDKTQRREQQVQALTKPGEANQD